MKLGKLASVDFKTHFKALLQQPGIPPKTAFALRGVSKVINEEVVKHDETKSAIVAEAIQRDENGEPIRIGESIKIKPEKAKELDAKLKELNDLEIALTEIKFDDLGSEHKLTAENLTYLEFIVE